MDGIKIFPEFRSKKEKFKPQIEFITSNCICIACQFISELFLFWICLLDLSWYAYDYLFKSKIPFKDTKYFYFAKIMKQTLVHNWAISKKLHNEYLLKQQLTHYSSEEF